MQQGDGERACALLAPETRSTLEESAGQPCARAVLMEELPPLLRASTVRVYGGEAHAVFDVDIVFLSEFSDGWRVVAAGCEPRGELPYDCAIDGG